MKVTVLRGFPYAEDGHTVRHLSASDEPVEIRDALVEGLVLGGYVTHPDAGEIIRVAFDQLTRAELFARVLEFITADLERASDEELRRRLVVATERKFDALGLGASHHFIEPVGDDEPQMLYGSSVLPAHVQIGDKMVQLGGLVVAAHRASGLTPEDWNDLPEGDREAALAATLERLNGDLLAGSVEIDQAAVISTVKADPIEPALGAEPPAVDPAKAFDHDGDGKPGGAPKGGNRKKSTQA